MAPVATADAQAVENDLWQFDFDHIAERDRRVRAEHENQYVTVGEGKGAKFSHWLDDHWTKRVEREPIDLDLDVLVLGTGFSGILTASKLKDRGITSFKMLDAAGDFGGTWYWNRYPGAACDSESYCYLLYLEQSGYMPSAKYVPGFEIREHTVRLAKQWDLYPHAIFQTMAKEMRWSEEEGKWTVTTDRGDSIKARFLVQCGGPINCPHLPDVPGIDSFKGHEFHTARWDYDYTGGNPNGDFNLTKLQDKRVAVIGTGATGVQCIPYLGEWAKELYVFQRTPSAVDVRDNEPTDPKWYAGLEKGWQQKRDDAFQIYGLGGDAEVELDDGFSRTFTSTFSLLKRHMKTGEGKQYSIPDLLQLADFRHMERLRKRVDDVVKDKQKAEILKPWYNIWCKRPVYSDNYLPIFNKESVHVVDTADTKGIERITEKGVVVAGREYEVDCIVWSTGFESPARKVNFKLYGRGGLTRDEKFEKDGISTLFGIMMDGFPNLWYYGHAQGSVSVNFPSIYSVYADFTSYCISELLKRGVKEVEPTKEAEEEWTAEIMKLSRANPQFASECTPGYYNSEGNIEALTKAARGAAYGAGAVAYRMRLNAWMETGDLEGLQLKIE
ncbi:putative monooxygenase [Hyaloraphidium curvatum]|nr:putative monooxygenase [Hyaloraphidium curvatum]